MSLASPRTLVKMLRPGPPDVDVMSTDSRSEHSSSERRRWHLEDTDGAPSTPNSVTNDDLATGAMDALDSSCSIPSGAPCTPERGAGLRAKNLGTACSFPSDPLVRYHVNQELRTSLFGTVLFAYDKISSHPVAIKLSNVDLVRAGRSSTGCPVVEDPLLESCLLQRLPAHPFVVSLHDEHIVDNVHWMVLEYVPNGDLFEYLLQSAPLAPQVARNYVRQIAEALLHIHEHKVCHLDVSLENVLLDAEHNVKLTDFGVARCFAKQGSSVYPGIQRAEKPGKVRYMAPEVLASQPFDGCLVDSFALGVIMFCLLVGSAPFERARIKDTRWQFVATGNFAGLFEYLGVPSPSASAVDLLKGLLTTADKRLTMAAVLRHPWFSERLV